MTFSQINALSLREQVVEQIRTAIIEGRLKPNDHIVETNLTQQFGVSRTPVREALILLERDGLIVSYPNRGSFVRNFTAEDVSEIFSMRTALENLAGELIIHQLTEADYLRLEDFIQRQQDAISTADFKVVRSLDMNFHEYIVNRSQHSLLMHSWHQIVAQIAALLYIRAEAFPDYDEMLAIHDHTAIVQAYRQRNLAELFVVNQRVNARVAGECRAAIELTSSRR